MKLALAFLAAAAMPVAVLAQTVDIETAAGPATVPANPEVVVALDLAAVDSLAALDVPVAGVAKVAPPAYLADTLGAAETVGTLFEPDFEALAVMGPDLIIAGGRSQRQVQPLSAIAPTIDMTIDGQNLIGDARARVTAYGEIFGRQEAATALLEQLDAAAEAAKTAAEGKGDFLILMTNGGKVSAYGADSRFGWIHSDLGLPEAFPNLKAETHGEAVSFEFIADVNPDWLLVIDRGAAIGQEGEAAAVTLDTPLVAGTTAGQKGQIVYLDSAKLYLSGGGIQATLGTIDEITTALTSVGG